MTICYPVLFIWSLPLRGAQECANTCESTLAGKSCKICGSSVSGSSLQSAMEGEATCNFCPDGLQRQYWENEIPFIGSNATCFKLNQFFLNYQLPESDANCQLALNFNYIYATVKGQVMQVQIMTPRGWLLFGYRECLLYSPS